MGVTRAVIVTVTGDTVIRITVPISGAGMVGAFVADKIVPADSRLPLSRALPHFCRFASFCCTSLLSFTAIFVFHLRNSLIRALAQNRRRIYHITPRGRMKLAWYRRTSTENIKLRSLVSILRYLFSFFTSVIFDLFLSYSFKNFMFQGSSIQGMRLGWCGC